MIHVGDESPVNMDNIRSIMVFRWSETVQDYVLIETKLRDGTVIVEDDAPP